MSLEQSSKAIPTSIQLCLRMFAEIKSRQCKLIQPLRRTVWRFLKKLKIELSYGPEIPLLGIYPGKNKLKKKQNTCTPVLTAALFKIARSWKTPKCPSTNEWIKKMWYIYTRKHYSFIKKNKIGSFAEMWMYLQTIKQSEVSQKEKNQCCIWTHLIYMESKKMVQMKLQGRRRDKK